ncbi:MAG: proline reductase-associated electron transfer protein PrdC, partial [Fusobacteriaceae bacterium]
DYLKIRECDSLWETALEAGIIGAGGGGFPTHLKLKGKKVSALYINAAECESNFFHNIEILKNSDTLHNVLWGSIFTAQAVEAEKIYFCIKGIYSKIIKKIKTYMEDKREFQKIEILELEDIYPVGEERALINRANDSWIPSQELPYMHSSLVLNIETVKNIYMAVKYGKPVIDKDITLIGNFKNQPKVKTHFGIDIGLPIKEITGDSSALNKILEYPLGEFLEGGANTGKSSSIEEVYIEKTSGGGVFTLPFPEFRGKLGLLVCACGGNEKRLREIGVKMHSEIIGVQHCKNIGEKGKCETPGKCPGQAEAVLKLKKSGAIRVLVSTCTDCTNTVMRAAIPMGIGVYHSTDHIHRTFDYPITREREEVKCQ